MKRIVAEESILNERGRVMTAKLRPIIYNEEEGADHEVGAKFADSFKSGLEMKKALTGGSANDR